MALAIEDHNQYNGTAAELLKQRGYFTDDECYGKHGIDSNGVELERVLRLHGYTGGRIETVATYVSGYGNVYLAYDSAKLSHNEAMEVLANFSYTMD